MYQSGFHANFSTDSCLVQLTDFILRGMDKGFHTGMILVDLQKANDTLDHTVLLQKMECIGFKESDVRQKVFCDTRKCFSDAWLINCCVPQGSTLVRLLLLIYINDLPQALKRTGS